MHPSGMTFHKSTCYDRNRMKGHPLDWSNQPRVFKAYNSIAAIPLPKVDKLPETDLLASLSFKDTQTFGKQT